MEVSQDAEENAPEGMLNAFFHLKKHVEASNCLHRERLWQLVYEYAPGEEAPAAADRPSIIAQVALDPGVLKN